VKTAPGLKGTLAVNERKLLTIRETITGSSFARQLEAAELASCLLDGLTRCWHRRQMGWYDIS